MIVKRLMVSDIKSVHYILANTHDSVLYVRE